ncbi:MAG: hypothetical protein HY940_04450 [Gammaproteobacteria bacterium]|nr:hypothetical protein [Gammaproteobacteria bacterium]
MILSLLTVALLAPHAALRAADNDGIDTLPDPLHFMTLKPQTDGAQRSDAASRLELQSTIISADRKLAVINGHAIPVGMTIEGAKLLAVRNNEATIIYQGVTRTLSIVDNTIIKQWVAHK